MRIVVCLRDPAVRQAVALALRVNGDTIDNAEDVEDAKIFCTFPVNALVIDDEDRDVFKAIQTIRRERASRNVSIIGLTLGAVAARVALLNAGADDALDRPFHRDELVARITAVVRRRQGSCDDFVSFGNLTFDFAAREVRVNDRPLHATKNEYRMLESLARANGRLVTRNDVAEFIWGDKIDDLSDTRDHLGVIAWHIRSKLALAESTASILTIWGRGLMLGVPVRVANPLKPKSRFVYDTTQIVEQPAV